MEETKLIEVSVDLEFKDFWQVLFKETLKKIWFIYLIALFVSLPLIFVFFYALVTNPQKIKFSPVIVIPLMPLLAVLLIQWSIYSTAKRNTESVRGKSYWTFSEDGFKTSTAISKSENSWESLEKVKETSRYFLLYPQKNIFMIIPQRFFQNESQLDDFRSLVRKQIGNKAKLRND